MVYASFILFATILSIPLSCHANDFGPRRLTNGTLSEYDKQALLNEHNKERSQTALGKTGVQPMSTNSIKLVWDETIAASAKGWADNCKFQHEDQHVYGENIYTTGSSINNIDNIRKLVVGAKSWYDEHHLYTYDTSECTGVCGHYTQSVWATSTKIGCGYSECPFATFGFPFELLLVCRYDPPGNFVGEKPYISTSDPSLVASDCPSGYTGNSTSGLCELPSASVTTPVTTPVPPVPVVMPTPPTPAVVPTPPTPAVVPTPPTPVVVPTPDVETSNTVDHPEFSGLSTPSSSHVFTPILPNSGSSTNSESVSTGGTVPVSQPNTAPSSNVSNVFIPIASTPSQSVKAETPAPSALRIKKNGNKGENRGNKGNKGE